MNCDEARRHWHLYHDSEGDAQLHWQINDHLSNCAACAEWFAKQSRFESLLCEKLASAPADDALWPAVLEGAGLVRPAATRRWMFFSSMLACAASLLLALFGWWQFAGPHRSGAGPSLSELTADWHEQLAVGDAMVPFSSESDLAVEDYLRQEVPFPVRCPPRKDSGFAVQGAGACDLAGQPAAYVVGRVGESPVSIFILSRDSLAAFPHQQAALKTERVHRCREGNYEMALSVVDRNVVLVVGRAAPESLLRVLRSYGTYPHHRA